MRVLDQNSKPYCDRNISVNLTNASVKPQQNLLRTGYLNISLYQILSMEPALNHLLGRATLTTASPLSVDNLNAIYNIISIGEPIPESTKALLTDLISDMGARGFSIADQWRFVSIALVGGYVNAN